MGYALIDYQPAARSGTYIITLSYTPSTFARLSGEKAWTSRFYGKGNTWYNYPEGNCCAAGLEKVISGLFLETLKD